MTSIAPSTALRAGLYARVSTFRQARDDLSIPDQLRRCREYAQQHGWTVVAEYRDDGISGLTADRPAFQRMRDDAHADAWDHLVIYSSDRLARAPEIAIGYESALERLGIGLHYVEEPDVPGHYGQLLHRIKQGFDEFFSYDLSEKTKRAQAARRKRGKPMISQPPFGYRREGETFAPHALEAAAISAAYQWLIEGLSWAEIGARLDAMGVRPRKADSWARYPTVLPRMLRNPLYAGLMTTEARYRRRWVGNDRYRVVPPAEWELAPTEFCPPLVSREIWARVQGILDARAERKAGSKAYLLSGILRCPVCQHKLVGRTEVKQNRRGRPERTVYIYYVCTTRAVEHRQRNWRLAEVEARVFAALDEAQKDAGAVGLMLRDPADSSRGVELVIADARIAEIEAEIERIFLAAERGLYDVETAIQRRDQKRAELVQAREDLERLKGAPQIPATDLRPVIAEISEVLRDPVIPVLAKRQVLAANLAGIDLVEDADPPRVEFTFWAPSLDMAKAAWCR